jgi:integrase
MINRKHNYTSIEQYKDEDGRVKISPEVMKLLRPTPTDDPNKVKKTIIKDKHLLGFRAVVNPGGTKTFLMRLRPKKLGTNKYSEHLVIKLGNYFDSDDPNNKTGITCAVARKMAEEIRNEFRLGKDPYKLLAAKKAGKSFVDVAEKFEANRIDTAAYKDKTKITFLSLLKNYVYRTSKKEKYKRLYRAYNQFFSVLDQPIKNITKDDYIAIHKAVSVIGKYTANRLMELLRLIEQYAIEINELEKRVCIFKKKELNKEYKRVEINDPYSVYELKQYRKAVLSLIKKDYERYLVPGLMLLATTLIGARSKSQVFQTKWEDIKSSNKILYKDTKNDEPQNIMFDYRFNAILRMMNQYRKNHINHKDKRFKYVFPSLDKSNKSKFLKDPRKTHLTICRIAGIRILPIHFLRHSWATNDYAAHGDIYVTKENGGWKDIKSVMVYAKVSDEIKKKRLKQQREYLAKKSHVA